MLRVSDPSHLISHAQRLHISSSKNATSPVLLCPLASLWKRKASLWNSLPRASNRLRLTRACRDGAGLTRAPGGFGAGPRRGSSFVLRVGVGGGLWGEDFGPFSLRGCAQGLEGGWRGSSGVVLMASLSVEVGLLLWRRWGVVRAVSSEEEDVDWGAAGEHCAAAP